MGLSEAAVFSCTGEIIVATPSSESLSISVCICTYNRSQKLLRLLNNINDELQVPSNCRVEFVVVDNNSSDDTRNIVESFECHYPLRYEFEARQGLSYARNHALEVTDSDWVCFTDDDVILEQYWLHNYYIAISSNDADYLGGRILLNWQHTARPAWLKDENMSLIAGVLCKYDLGENIIEYTESMPTPYGASFALSRRLIDKNGIFRVDLGVIGSVPGRGEETEYFQRAKGKDALGFYCGEVICYHDVWLERLTTRHMFLHGVEKGKAESIIENHSPTSIWAEWLFWLKGIRQCLLGRYDRYLQCVINAGILHGKRKAQKQVQGVPE